MADLSGIDPQPPAPPAHASITYRGLLAAVILMGVLIVIALGVLVFGLVTRLGHGAHSAGSSGAAEFVLPQGARLVSMDVAGERLVLHLRGPAGDEIDIVDTQSGRAVAKIRTAPPRK